MDPNSKLLPDQRNLIQILIPDKYRKLVGKLSNLTLTRPDMSFTVGVVSQFMQSPCVDH